MQNSLNQQPQKLKFSVAITTKGYKDLINNTLGDADRAKRFVASITSAVAVNPALQDCDAGTILAGALLGESLNLSPSPQLGQYYLVPFKQKAKFDKNGKQTSKEMTKAQFVLGYKGLIQLAIRSGQYRSLNVLEIKEGELIRFDPLTETIECRIMEDWNAREKAPTIGYFAMFEYTNGFRKTMYWSKEKMIAHADRYSPAFSAKDYKRLLDGKIADKDLWKYSSFWYKNFDDMAKKTMLRQLISRWGVMSIDLQNAMTYDAAVREVVDGDFITTTEDELPPVEVEAPETEAPETAEEAAAPEQEVIDAEVIDIDKL